MDEANKALLNNFKRRAARSKIITVTLENPDLMTQYFIANKARVISRNEKGVTIAVNKDVWEEFHENHFPK